MYHFDKEKVGFYKDMKSTAVYPTDLLEILKAIQEGRWANRVIDYRATGNGTIKESLPCFTVSGIFSPTKSAENLKSFSGVLSLDLDSTELAHDVVRSYVEDALDGHLISFFRSTGGKGYCVLVSIKQVESADQFKRVYEAVYRRLAEKLPSSIKFDHLPNINRLRYVSFDPQLCFYPLSKPFEKELEFPNQATFPLPKSEKNVVVNFGNVSDEEKLQIVLERYVNYAGDFGQEGARHDWILGLARWACRADIDERYLADYCLSNYQNSARADVWKNEVVRCVRDSYRSYSAERGTVEIEKKFSFDDILRATNVEQVREQLIWYIADKTNYKKSLEENKKSVTFIEKEIKFLTKILNYL